MAPCGSPTDMLIMPRWAGGSIGASRAFSRANGKSVRDSVRRGLNIHDHPWGISRTMRSAGLEGSCRSSIYLILNDKLAFNNKAIGRFLQESQRVRASLPGADA